MGGAALFWNIDACLTAMPFFFFGYCYKMHHEKAAGLFSRKLLMILSFFLFGAINIYCYQKTWEISGSGLEMFFSEYGSPIYTYISAFAGIVSVILLSHLWVIKPLRYIGENSMLYYAWHQLIMMPIVEAFLENLGYSSWGNQRYTVIYKIVSVTIIVIITTICNEIIKRSRMAFILGK